MLPTPVRPIGPISSPRLLPRRKILDIVEQAGGLSLASSAPATTDGTHTMAASAPTSRSVSPTKNSTAKRRVVDMSEQHLVVVMVGLPARGKTYISKKLTRYLNWIGMNTRAFHQGDYRRKAVKGYIGHFFYALENEEGQNIQRQCAIDALNDMADWMFNHGGSVGVFDATNTTRERRDMIYQFCKSKHLNLLFIESLCDNNDVLTANISEVKICSPDYQGMDKEKALSDFLQRIAHYAKAYEPLDNDLDKCVPFIKVINCGERYLVNRVAGHIQSKIVYYLMNTHVTPRNIYLTRHGESEHNLMGRIGGDADLTQRGWRFAEELATFIDKQNLSGMQAWTSQLKRTVQTAWRINAPILQWKALNEIDAGVCDEMTYEEIQEKHPNEFSLRDENKFTYRYPKGESYEDLVSRLEPVIMELERQENILVICHQGVMRCLLAYFLDNKSEDLPYIKCPLHTVFKLTPIAYGCRVEELPLSVPAIDTHRPKPSICKLGRRPSEALSTVPPHY